MLTIIVQSSSATVGLTMALATQGLLTFPGAMALVLGENIGTTITAELATIGSSDVNAHRAARAHTMFNVIGVGIMLLVFPYFVDLVTFITGWMGTGPVGQVANGEAVNVARYIANGHTLFNLINAGIFLLFLPWLIKIATALSPKREEPEDLFQLPKFDNRFVDSPLAALAQTRSEIVRMSETAMITLENTVNCILERDPKKLSKWKRYEEHLDVMQKEIIAFLTSIYQGDVSADVAGEISNLMRITNNIERVGDAVENLAKRTEDLIENNIPFTPEAQADVKKIATQVMGFLNLVNEGLQTDTPRLFQKAELLENIIDQLREEMRHAHIVRLRQGECSIDPGLIFLDLLANLERIGDFCFSCVKAMGRDRRRGTADHRCADGHLATQGPRSGLQGHATANRAAGPGPVKLFNILAVLITLSALFSYLNHRFIRLPTPIGLMLIALLVSLGMIAGGPLGFGFAEGARHLLASIDFDETLLHGMLSFLLFAGALHINLGDLARQKWVISLLATGGMLGSTFLAGLLSWWVFQWVGVPLPADLLSDVRRPDFTDRSDRRAQYSQKRRLCPTAWKPKSRANPFSTTGWPWWFSWCCLILPAGRTA